MFEERTKISDVAMNILRKRYFKEGETTWEEVVDRVVSHVCNDYDEIERELVREMMLYRYFIPNSPCLVNSGTRNNGLSACFVVDFTDSIEGIYKTKLDFALIAKKGGGCGTTLSKLRPENSTVEGSAHGYAGGPIKFYDTLCHDMEAMTQSGFRQMAMMGTMSVYHPDILKFLTAKTEEGKMTTTNISVVVDDAFMYCVKEDGNFQTYFDFESGRKYFDSYKARDIFNLIVDGAWKNGEPGILFYNAMNDSPYKYSYQEILATNPCLSGDTLIQTVEGQIKIKDLIGKEVDVYCMSDTGVLEISKAFNIRKTQENAKLVRVQTSRGHIICTPDHKFFTRNRGYVEAKDLTRRDYIVGLNKKMHGEHYCSVSLTGNKKYEKEHRFIMRHYEDISFMDVHHKDGNFLNNVKSNLEIMEHKDHSIVTNSNHPDWNEHDELGRFVKKENRKKKKQLQLDNGNFKGLNLCVIGVEELNYTEDVYDMEVETYHNFIANGVVVHNCGEQPLPPNGVCNLGSIDIAKFLNSDNELDLNLLETCVRLSIRFLDSVISRGTFPTKDITKWAEENRPVGLGIMGLADYFLKKEIAYGSEESISELEFILSFISKISEDESIGLGETYGVPEACKVLPIPRRNITLISIAPTGTISLLAGCSSSIEPIFSEITVRNDKTGSYSFTNDLFEKPYFRCAVSANGTTEVTWEEHVNMQAAAQRWTDSGVSKTINFPNHTHRDTISKSFMLAWELGCKGITVYRNGSRRVEVLSPKALKKDLCPLCGHNLKREGGCRKCTNCEFSVCDA